MPTDMEQRALDAEQKVAQLETEKAALEALVASLRQQLTAQAAPKPRPASPEEGVPEPAALDGGSPSTARDEMQQYWEQQTANLKPSVEAMMLDEGAAKIDQAERPEVLDMLPALEGKDIVEMGSGIGRFTGELGRRAKSVLACDFVDASIQANAAAHGDLGNCEFLCADATKMERPADSSDLVFSNWLLMYLTDDEVCELFAKSLRWLRPGGYMFFRESCFHQSGNAKRKENPTKYRSPGLYHKMAQDQMQMVEVEAQAAGEAQPCFVFELVTQKALQSYVELKGNHNQIAWLFQKRETSIIRNPTRGAALQTYLDTHRYTDSSIRIYERMYGDGYVSCGGAETTAEFVGQLALQSGERVLDVGCGIGGGWQQLAYDYEVHVVGVDLSVNMVNIALERRVTVAKQQPLEKRQLCDVAFQVADIMSSEFADGSFDVIYSRDSLLHIQDKPALFERLLRWLKPGGRMLFTDYCQSSQPLSPEFADYIHQRQYSLLDPESYGTIVGAAGFEEVAVEDRTEQMVACMRKELAAIKTDAAAQAFKADFGADDYTTLLSGWESKLAWAGAGDFKWALITAKKPS